MTLSLSDVWPEFMVEFVKVSDKVMSACRSEVALRVNCEVQMITLVGKAGCNVSSGTQSIVVSKLS